MCTHCCWNLFKGIVIFSRVHDGEKKSREINYIGFSRGGGRGTRRETSICIIQISTAEWKKKKSERKSSHLQVVELVRRCQQRSDFLATPELGKVAQDVSILVRQTGPELAVGRQWNPFGRVLLLVGFRIVDRFASAATLKHDTHKIIIIPYRSST